jgi:nucleoside-diphosphate-sugar epimerase
VREFVNELVDQYKNAHHENTTSLNFGAMPYRDGEVMHMNVNVKPLQDIGWESKVFFEDGIKKMLLEM